MVSYLFLKGEKMSDCVKVTECASCAHKDVCKYKEGYLKVCEAASNINVTLDNFDCIKGIEVHCKYYLIHRADR